MTDAALLLAAWMTVPVLMAGATWLRERHERRFPDCVVCNRQKGPQEPQNGPSRGLAATRRPSHTLTLYGSQKG